jgi:hypothetical protein
MILGAPRDAPADVVPKGGCRVLTRCVGLAADDRRFAGLADLPIVA